MRADAGLHADPTRRQIGESGLHLAYATTSAAARWHRADPGQRCGTSSCRYRCRLRRGEAWVFVFFSASFLLLPPPPAPARGVGGRPPPPPITPLAPFS